MRIKWQANLGGTNVGVYYRWPDQEEEVNKAVYWQLKVTLQSQALALMGDHPDICWKSTTVRHVLSRRFL